MIKEKKMKDIVANGIRKTAGEYLWRYIGGV